MENRGYLKSAIGKVVNQALLYWQNYNSLQGVMTGRK
jgi:hypothetical protein